jgi:hypothetical protein
MDGGTGENGWIMAPNFAEFFREWAAVCFQNPKSLWWKSAIGPEGVDWRGEQFNQELRLRG